MHFISVASNLLISLYFDDIPYLMSSQEKKSKKNRSGKPIAGCRPVVINLEDPEKRQKKPVKKDGDWTMVILEIPVCGPLPSMWDKDERKQESLKWLDDKPCMYHTIGFSDGYFLVTSSPEHIIREWLEKFIVPMLDNKFTVDELIKLFINEGLSELADDNWSRGINEMRKAKDKIS